MTTRKPTEIQINTKRASMAKLLDSAGGREALQSLLVERMDGDLLFDVLKAQRDNGVNLYDTYDAIKTFCELDNDGDPWRLVRQSEVIDEEKHIDCTDKDEVFAAAEALDILVFENEEALNDRDWYQSSDPKLVAIVIDCEPFSDTLGQLIAKQCAESTYEYDGLAMWFELYGMELRRRDRRTA